MNFAQYSEELKAFQKGAFTSIQDSYDDICRAQDQLITQLTDKGAQVKGWKLVEDSGIFILSPIFDFQVFPHHGAQLPQQALMGIEVEICYHCRVPHSETDAAAEINRSQPLVAIEALRPKINNHSYNACDFYFNYGILVANQPVSGEFSLLNGEQNYAYSASEADFIEQKKSTLWKGVIECIRRGYVEEEYFFMTGSLNGLIETATCLGENHILQQGNKLISFELV